MNAAEQRLRDSGEPIRVAVVDNEELFRRGLTMLLSLEDGIEVVGEAGDGIAATELAAVTAPDVILMDVRMPKRSGIEACVAIKEVAPVVRIIMLTVSDEEADLYDAVKNGAAGYLLKDSSIDEVAQAVRVVGDRQSLISPAMAIKLLDEFKQLSAPTETRHRPPPVTPRELEVLSSSRRACTTGRSARGCSSAKTPSRTTCATFSRSSSCTPAWTPLMYAMREKLFDVPDR